VNLLDRYILKSVLVTCVGAMALFAFVLLLGNVIRDLLGYVLAGQLPLVVFGKLVLLILPAVAIYALPMGMLTGVLLTLGRLSADSEITAMRAVGLSIPRIARPVIILGLLAMAGALFVNFESMPRARVQYHKQLAQAIRANPLRIIVPKTFLHNFKGCVVYVGEKQGEVMRDFWLWQLDNDRRVTRVVHAESGRFDYDENTNELTLILTRAQVEIRNQKNPEDFSTPPQVASFEQSEQMRFGLDSVFGRAAVYQKQQWMTFAELRAERTRLAAQPVPLGKSKEVARARMKLELIIQEKYRSGGSRPRLCPDWNSARHQSLAPRNLRQSRYRGAARARLQSPDGDGGLARPTSRISSRSAAVAAQCDFSRPRPLAAQPDRPAVNQKQQFIFHHRAQRGEAAVSTGSRP